jgi:hypothetical protein
VTLATGRIESGALLKLTVGKPCGLSSDLHNLLSNIYHLPEFVDSVIDSMYLNFDLRLELVDGDFS